MAFSDRCQIRAVNHGRILLIVLLAALAAVFFATGLHEQVTLAGIKEKQTFLQDLHDRRPAAMTAAFSALYIAMVTLNLPGALALGLAAGAVFGTITGTIIISFASSIGATLACLLSRHLLRDWVQRRFGAKLQRVNSGIREEGAFYLFALRLMPVIPFFMINLVMGLTAMPLRTFYWVSQLGMLPGTAIFVNAGSQIGAVDSLAGVLSPGLLASLALLGIFPLTVRRGLGFVRNRYRPQPAVPNAADMTPADSPLAFRQREIGEHCTECGACQRGCAFLTRYGTPKSIVTQHDFSSSRSQAIAYECSLCGLCTAVCPEKLDPAALFLEVRRRCAADGNLDESVYRTILGYEKKGYSPLFSWYGLPDGCDTIFFPGCALPGTRPAVTADLYRRIREIIPSVGLVLDCCTKPSHDLGRTERFQTLFGEMHAYLINRGIRNVVTACPNCTKIFRQYGLGMTVRTVYDLLHAGSKPNGAPVRGAAVTVHDPCPLRDDSTTQRAVRAMLTDMGYNVAEMKHRGKRTVCCGEGGTVGAVNRQLAGQWGALRRRESGGRRIVTYCAGCTGYLNRVVPTVHIADLLYQSGSDGVGKIKVARAPLTYWNRLRLKRAMRREIRPAVQRTRPADLNGPSLSA